MVKAESYMQYVGKVVENTELCQDIYEIVLECPGIAQEAGPGQFLHIKVGSGPEPLLRRPISISRIDKNAGTVSLIYRLIGRGTMKMVRFSPGDAIDVLGPLGNGFEIFPGKRCAVIGGGMGVAPLLELAARIPGCDAYMGFRCGTFKVEEYKQACREVHIATEDGSQGTKGYVTDLIENIGSYDIVYTCGPKPMLKRIKELCESSSVRCYVSIEERMGCGIGACLVCACKVKEGDTWHYKKACTDGPVFEAGEVDFCD